MNFFFVENNGLTYNICPLYKYVCLYISTVMNIYWCVYVYFNVERDPRKQKYLEPTKVII